MLRHIAAWVIIVVNVFFGGKLLIPFQDFKLSLKQNFICLHESMNYFAEMPKKDVLKLALKHNRMDRFHHWMTSQEKVFLPF